MVSYDDNIRTDTESKIESARSQSARQYEESLARQVELKKEFYQLRSDFHSHEKIQAQWTGEVNQKLDTLAQTTRQIAQDIKEMKR